MIHNCGLGPSSDGVGVKIKWRWDGETGKGAGEKNGVEMCKRSQLYTFIKE